MPETLLRAWEFIQAGGPVMWPLVALSLWLWTLVVITGWRLWQWGREGLVGRAARRVLRGEDPLPQAVGPRSAALAMFLSLPRRTLSTEGILWEAAVRHQLPGLKRGVDTVVVLAAAAPLLGLLGTVTGMIETFEVIRLFGTGNAKAMAGGISEALITTQTGLMVAIPGLLAGHWLRRQARKLEQGLMAFKEEMSRSLEEAGIC